MIKAIIFDMDDLMVNSASLHEEATARAFAKYGVDTGTRSCEMVASIFGLRVFEIIEMMVKQYGLADKVDLNKLFKEREKIFLRLADEKLETMPGLETLILLLKKCDYKYALGSSGTKDYVNLVVKKFGLGNFFKVIVSGDDVKKAKPDPEIFIKTAGRLGVKPGECVVIEDSTNGIMAAKAAGMFCIGVENEGPYKQDLSRADITVKRLNYITKDLLRGLLQREDV